MPKDMAYTEAQLIEACNVARREEKPNFSRIARQFGVPPKTLSNRVKKGVRPRSENRITNRRLDKAQEEGLIRWIGQLKERGLPVTPKLIEGWANRALARAGGPEQKVGGVWVYRFMKRLPPDLHAPAVPELHVPAAPAVNPNRDLSSVYSPSVASSGDENTFIAPPNPVEALQDNLTELSACTELLVPELQRHLEGMLNHNRAVIDHANQANEIILQTLAALKPTQRQTTNR